MNPPAVIEAAIAILYQDDRFLLQLRDDIPTIVYPGQWTCFGGHVESGEVPETALRRELKEEIDYRVTDAVLFGHYEEPGVIRHVFACPLTVDISALELKEGWDMGLFTREEIGIGHCYSQQAQQLKALALPHQQCLLDYFQS